MHDFYQLDKSFFYYISSPQEQDLAKCLNNRLGMIQNDSFLYEVKIESYLVNSKNLDNNDQ